MSSSTNPIETSAYESDPDDSLDLHPTFICTICWQRQRGSSPKLLGASARIVCRACWRAVLDLSICWVCGECIVRGDEVVSLGWCFWHRGCFGCLVCGTRLDVPTALGRSICSDGEGEGEKRDADEKGEGENWDGSEDEAGAMQSARCMGVELEEIPMCTVCEVETAGESPDRVLQRGLETVTRSDGGLSRSRLDMLSEAKDADMQSAQQCSAANTRRIRGAIRTVEGLKSVSLCRSNCHTSEPLNAEDLSPLIQNASEMGISEDGSMDECHSHGDTEMCELGHAEPPDDQDAAASIVYVSVLDPIGEPTFRPSKTKPLPKWMYLLPSNVRRNRERRAKTAAEVSKSSHEIEYMGESRGSNASDGSDGFNTHTPVPGARAVSTTGKTKKRTAPSMIDIPQKIQKRAPVVAFDPTAMPKGDTAEDSSCKLNQRSQTVDTACLTTEEHPCSHLSQPQTSYPRSPYPSRPSIARNETTSYFSHRPSVAAADDSINEQCYSSGAKADLPDSPTISLMRDFLSTPEPMIDISSPSQSSEYLERYHPKMAPEARYEKYVAGESEPILDRIKKQKAAVNHDADDDTKVKGEGVIFVDGQFGLDPRIPRREDLNKELRNLFRGE